MERQPFTERHHRRKVDPGDVLDRSKSVTAEWSRTHGINYKYSRLVNNSTLKESITETSFASLLFFGLFF